MGVLAPLGEDIYRQMKRGRMDHDKGRSLVLVLTQMRAMVEAEHLVRIEAKLTQLSETAQHCSPTMVTRMQRLRVVWMEAYESEEDTT
jgi:hypothetical protein